jgi:hypothetical protein
LITLAKRREEARKDTRVERWQEDSGNAALAGDLPPVRYRKQADSLTERYADLVRSAMSSPGGFGRGSAGAE